MRNIITYAVLLSTMLLVFSCKQNLQTYDDPINRLNFYYPSNPSDSTTRYTFVFEEDDFVRDTVWLQVRTMGFLSDSDREISVKQIEVEGELNAKPGDHYVAIDDPA